MSASMKTVKGGQNISCHVICPHFVHFLINLLFCLSYIKLQYYLNKTLLHKLPSFSPFLSFLSYQFKFSSIEANSKQLQKIEIYDIESVSLISVIMGRKDDDQRYNMPSSSSSSTDSNTNNGCDINFCSKDLSTDLRLGLSISSHDLSSSPR